MGQYTTPHQACVSCREVNQLSLGGSQGSEPNLLADMMCQIPLLRDILPSKSKKAVLSCSRQCHSLMHNLTTALMVNRLDDLKAISSSAWPSLGIVVIKKQELNSAAKDAIAQCKLQVLAVFSLYEWKDADYVALMLKPSTYQQCHNLGTKSLLLSLSRIMHTASPGSWEDYKPWGMPWLRRFALRQSQLDSGSLTQLLSMFWPRLESLDLSHATLDAAAAAALGQGHWPRLKTVFLNCSLLNIAPLCLRLRPGVKQLHLRGSSSAVPDTRLSAFVAAWSGISFLSLQGVQCGAKFGEWLARTLSGLDTLHLQSVSLDAQKLSGFMLVSWAVKHLNLSKNELGAEAMAVLALCSFSELCDLDLSHNQLDETAAQHLTTGRWPQLGHLDVSYNDLDNRALTALAEGQWPQLRSLRLQGNSIKSIDAVGVATLVNAWPSLNDLQLDHGIVGATTWALLDLAPASLGRCDPYLVVPRMVELYDPETLIWNSMRSVAFGKGPSGHSEF